MELKELRQNAGLSQILVSKALGYKTAGAYQKIESGKQPVRLEQIPALSKVFGVNVDFLLGLVYSQRIKL